MRFIYLLLFALMFSCNTEKVIQLPEIKNADIAEVLDVSPAYIFYDETQPDSTLFNRKNLISTTNWLVNVDKRLTLKQAIPHIQYLQNKRKKASMHKNENAKNYFTCNDTAIKNLGFLEFTDVEFNEEIKDSDYSEKTLVITFKNLDTIKTSLSPDLSSKFSKENLEEFLKTVQNKIDYTPEIILVFNKQMNFQDYITIKSEFNSFGATISNSEFFH